MTDSRIERFHLAPGDLPDMVCGVNGEAFEQEFRPEYFTVEWQNASLMEVRIWGHRVLKDGSLGKRLLDHRWRAAKGRAIKLADLPPTVAAGITGANDECARPSPRI
jgi:exodeoxyribonuclease-3